MLSDDQPSAAPGPSENLKAEARRIAAQVYQFCEHSAADRISGVIYALLNEHRPEDIADAARLD